MKTIQETLKIHPTSLKSPKFSLRKPMDLAAFGLKLSSF